jgi:hypothetical protein
MPTRADVRFVHVPVIAKMADIAWAAIFRQKSGRKAVLSIEDAGFPFDLPGRFGV